MRYGRSAIITAIAALASAGALAFASVGPAAAVDNVTGTGTTTCSAGYAGTFTFSPALKTGGTSTTEEVAVELSFTGCSGGSPVPVSGHYGAKGIVSGAGAINCANWFAPAVGTTPGIASRTFNAAPLDGDVAWSPTTINQSNVRFGNMRIRTGTGATNYLTFKLPIPPGTGVVTGSYAPTSQLVLRVTPAQTYAALSSACASAAGVPAVKIVPSSPAGSSTGTW
jgi:spore coat protein U-like protein